MKRVYIVRKSNYNNDPMLAFESEDDAVEIAESIHGRSVDAEEYVAAVPLIASEEEEGER